MYLVETNPMDVTFNHGEKKQVKKVKKNIYTMVPPWLIPERLVLCVQPSSALLDFSQYPADYSIQKQRGSNKHGPK